MPADLHTISAWTVRGTGCFTLEVVEGSLTAVQAQAVPLPPAPREVIPHPAPGSAFDRGRLPDMELPLDDLIEPSFAEIMEKACDFAMIASGQDTLTLSQAIAEIGVATIDTIVAMQGMFYDNLLELHEAGEVELNDQLLKHAREGNALAALPLSPGSVTDSGLH